MDQPLDAAPCATSNGLKACTWIPGAASLAAPSSLQNSPCQLFTASPTSQSSLTARQLPTTTVDQPVEANLVASQLITAMRTGKSRPACMPTG